MIALNRLASIAAESSFTLDHANQLLLASAKVMDTKENADHLDALCDLLSFAKRGEHDVLARRLRMFHNSDQS